MKKGEYPNYIAPAVRMQLERAAENIKKGGGDRIFAVDGREGSGKSTMALQLAYAFSKLMDVPFVLEDVVFSAEEFKARLKYFAENNIRHRIMIFDEAHSGLSSKGATSRETKELTQILMECRQLGMTIFMVLPSFFMLEKYVCLFRTHALFHVFSSKKDINRRSFRMYNYANKKMLYLHGRKFMSYAKPYIKKTYRFYSPFPPGIDEKEYDAKKLKAFQDHGNEVNTTNDKFFYRFIALAAMLKKKHDISYKDQERYLEEMKLPYALKNMALFVPKLPVNPDELLNTKD